MATLLPLTRQLGVDHSTPGDWKLLVNYIREAQIAQGVPKYEAYNVTT